MGRPRVALVFHPTPSLRRAPVPASRCMRPRAAHPRSRREALRSSASRPCALRCVRLPAPASHAASKHTVCPAARPPFPDAPPVSTGSTHPPRPDASRLHLHLGHALYTRPHYPGMSYAFASDPHAPDGAPEHTIVPLAPDWAPARAGPKIFAAQPHTPEPEPEPEPEFEPQHVPEHDHGLQHDYEPAPVRPELDYYSSARHAPQPAAMPSPVSGAGAGAGAGPAPRSPYSNSFSASPSLSPQPSPPADGPLSLASHYLPGKIGRMHRLGSRRHRGSSPYVDQQRRMGSHYEPITEEDAPSTPTGSTRGSMLGAGAFRRGDPSRWSTLSANLAAAKASPAPAPTLEQLAAAEGSSSPDLPPLGGHRSTAPSLLSQTRFSELALPKQGGGRDAWGPNGGGHAVLGAGGFEDDDGVNFAFASGSNNPTTPRDNPLRQRTVFSVTAKEVLDTYKDDPDTQGERSYVRRVFGGRGSDGKHKRHLRWNKFKWTFLVANTLLTVIAIGGLVGTILTWTNVWAQSDIVRVVNRTELILGTTAAALMFTTAILGWAGILLNNRAFLAVWTLLLWADFAFLVAPGYIAYKRHTFNLEGKMNETWSRALGVDKRRMVQNTLTCCGWFNPTIEASESNLCYARSPLPGCKGRMTRFERKALRWIYTCAFSLVGPHLVLIVVALLASNHITYRFGKGLTPPAYRLNSTTVARIQDDFLTKLTDMYGSDIVPAVLATQARLQHDRRSLPSHDDAASSVHLLPTSASNSAAHPTDPDTRLPITPSSPSESYLLPRSSQSHLGPPLAHADSDAHNPDPDPFADLQHDTDFDPYGGPRTRLPLARSTPPSSYNHTPIAYAQSRDQLMHSNHYH